MIFFKIITLLNNFTSSKHNLNISQYRQKRKYLLLAIIYYFKAFIGRNFQLIICHFPNPGFYIYASTKGRFLPFGMFGNEWEI